MKKITLVSIISFLFLSISSIVAFILRYSSTESKWFFFILGVILFIISGILAFAFEKYNKVNVICLIINSISLGFLIRAWYIFRSYNNSLWIMLSISILCVIYLWIYYLLLYIPFFDRHPVLFTVLFIILSLIVYVLVICLTNTTYISTFGFYMIVEIAFIICLIIKSKLYSDLIRNILLSSYSIVIVALLIGIIMLAGDGLDLDFDFGFDGIGIDSSPGNKKIRKEVEREMINDLDKII